MLESQALLLPEEKRDAELHRLKDRYLDKGHGACWLRQRPIAELVEQAILATDGAECLVLAWSIMPNHVHVVAELADDVGLGELLRTWKGPTARAANLVLGRSAPFGITNIGTATFVMLRISGTRFCMSIRTRSKLDYARLQRLGRLGRRDSRARRAEARGPRAASVTQRPSTRSRTLPVAVRWSRSASCASYLPSASPTISAFA